MRPKSYADITGYSYEDFVRFLFDREVPIGDESFEALASRGETNKWNPWYWNTTVDFDSSQILDHYLCLFRTSRFLLERYSKGQLEQGFWAIQTSNLACSAFEILWDGSLPFEGRADCVRSMYFLFRDCFISEPLESSVCMWWDSFCYSWHCGNRKRAKGGEDLLMQDVMFDTLIRILELESEICQGAALHGLSHLHHPLTEPAIQEFLLRKPDLSEDWKAAALASSRFELM